MPARHSGEQYTLEHAEDHIGGLRGDVDQIGEALTKTDSTDPPTNPASGLIHYSLAGHEKYASADANDYNTGRMTLNGPSGSSQNFTSTTPVTITGLSPGDRADLPGGRAPAMHDGWR